MTRILPPIPPIRAYANAQLDTTDSYSCDVPEYIQQEDLMEIRLADGTLAPDPVVTTLAADAIENTAVN